MAEDFDMPDSDETNTQEVPPASGKGRTSFLAQPGFGWGLALGMLTIILLAVVGAAVSALVMYRAVFLESEASPRDSVILAPVKAGRDWFSINSDGTGYLEGWSTGGYGSGDASAPGGEPQYTFEIVEVGAVGDLPIKHSVALGADNDTEFFVGSDRVVAKGKRTTVQMIFGEEGSGGPILDGEMRLKVEFRRQGNWLIATKVTADPNGPRVPEFLYY